MGPLFLPMVQNKGSQRQKDHEGLLHPCQVNIVAGHLVIFQENHRAEDPEDERDIHEPMDF
jgi:hypothetical protein